MKVMVWMMFFGMFNVSCASKPDAKRPSDSTETSAGVADERSGTDKVKKFDSLEEIDAALDETPWDIAVFEQGVVLLQAERDWKELERFYRRELRRAVNLEKHNPSKALTSSQKYVLWKELGQIYEYQLEHVDSARAAYSVALELRPDDEELQTKMETLRAKASDSSEPGAH